MRHKDVNWSVAEGKIGPGGGKVHEWQAIYVSLLLDIRDELKLMNSVLQCHNTAAIPHTLARIDRRLKAHLPLKKVTP